MDLGIIASALSLCVSIITILSVYGKAKAEKQKFDDALETLKKEVAEMQIEHETEAKELKTDIKELFDSRNKTNENLVRVSTILENLCVQMQGIDKKIDEIKAEIREKK